VLKSLFCAFEFVAVRVGPLERVVFTSVGVGIGEGDLYDFDGGNCIEFVAGVSEAESCPDEGGKAEGLGSTTVRASTFGFVAMLACKASKSATIISSAACLSSSVAVIPIWRPASAMSCSSMSRMSSYREA